MSKDVEEREPWVGMQTGAAAVDNRCNSHVVQQFYFWAYTPKSRRQALEQVCMQPFSQQHYVQHQIVAEQDVKSYDGALSRLRKEGDSDTCYSTGEPWTHHAK